MLELKIQCEDADEARMYLNAPQYLAMLQDLGNALRNARKHDDDVAKVVDVFLEDFAGVGEHNLGPY